MGDAISKLKAKFSPHALYWHELREETWTALSAMPDEDLVALAVSPGGRPADDSPFSSSTTDNWVAKAGGLPTYIREVAHAMVRKGHDESKAIEMAVGIVRNWAEGKGKVSAKVRAAAAAAIAEWEKKRGQAHAT
jgi:hypothetical protein